MALGGVVRVSHGALLEVYLDDGGVGGLLDGVGVLLVILVAR